MSKGKYVSLELVKGSERDYLIKDKSGITIGRIFIIDLDKKNKHCLFRINFYKREKGSYEHLKDTLKLMLNILFINMDIYKVNVICDDEINISAFTELGFELEGVISDSIVHNYNHKSELMFGINEIAYQKIRLNKNLIIKGKRIELRILTPDNAEEVLEYYMRNKEHLKPFEPTRDEEFYTLEMQKQTLIEGYKQFLNGESINLGIYKDDMFIGKMRISNMVMGIFRNAFIGYSIDENYQGNGYMKEAIRLSLDYAFNDLELHRIEASTLVDNVKSQRALKACGFMELGISKKYLYINSEWRDHIIFYLNKNFI